MSKKPYVRDNKFYGNDNDNSNDNDNDTKSEL